MTLRKLLLGCAAALLLSLALVPSARASGTASSDASARSTDTSENVVGGLCYAALCESEADCWNSCPGASSVSCVSNECQYTYPGGGGGGGGGGPFCDARLCNWDGDCTCNTAQGYCGTDNVCHY